MTKKQSRQALAFTIIMMALAFASATLEGFYGIGCGLLAIIAVIIFAERLQRQERRHNATKSQQSYVRQVSRCA